MAVCHVANTTIRDPWRNLAEIHAAPEWLWAALVARRVEGGWTVAVTREWVAAQQAGLQRARGAGSSIAPVNIANVVNFVLAPGLRARCVTPAGVGGALVAPSPGV